MGYRKYGVQWSELQQQDGLARKQDPTPIARQSRDMNIYMKRFYFFLLISIEAQLQAVPFFYWLCLVGKYLQMVRGFLLGMQWMERKVFV